MWRVPVCAYAALAKLPGWHQPGVSQDHLGHACFSFTCFAQVAQVWSTLELLLDPILVPDILPARLHAASQQYLAYAYSHLQLSCLGDSGVEPLQLLDLCLPQLQSSHQGDPGTKCFETSNLLLFQFQPAKVTRPMQSTQMTFLQNLERSLLCLIHRNKHSQTK